MLHLRKSGRATLDSPSTAKRWPAPTVGCPILARSLRKSGIPQTPTASVFLKSANISRLAIILITLTLLSACRLDMQVQPRQNPLSRSDFFSDQRSERPVIDGTVARGQLHENSYFYTGKIGNNPGDAMPFAVSKEVLQRGQERYNIFCAPCHSRLGDGNGFVPSRGFSKMPPSFHIARLQKAPLGYFFDIITEGFGIMPDYAAQIPPQDRWDIVAYVRALQLSQNATMNDVPSGQNIPSQPLKFGQPGTGASLPAVLPENSKPQSSKPEEEK
jgi:mono/diheme cytochrome c family protein